MEAGLDRLGAGPRVSDQGALFGISVPPGLKLGDRQWLVLEELKREPRTSFQLGEAAHRKRGCNYCSKGLECYYAESEGAQVASSLRSHGLVKYSRLRGVWYLVETGLPPAWSDAQDQPIPF